ncbi:MAG: hypothetical protein R3A47_01975 [Polyangiales bacterium]
MHVLAVRLIARALGPENTIANAIAAFGPFLQNLATVAALVAIVFALRYLLQIHRAAPWQYRVLTSAFGFAFVASCGLLVITPQSLVPLHRVFIVCGVGYTAVTFVCGMLFLRNQSPLFRTLSFAFLILNLGSLVLLTANIVVRSLGSMELESKIELVSRVLQFIYMATLFVLSAICTKNLGRHARLSVATVLGIAALVAFAVHRHLGADWDVLLYGAFHLDLSTVGWNPIFAALGTWCSGVALLAAVYGSRELRLLGTANLAMLASGYSPLNAADLSQWVLGVALFTLWMNVGFSSAPSRTPLTAS